MKKLLYRAMVFLLLGSGGLYAQNDTTGTARGEQTHPEQRSDDTQEDRDGASSRDDRLDRFNVPTPSPDQLPLGDEGDFPPATPVEQSQMRGEDPFDTQMRAAGMVEVPPRDVPASLRRTLEDERYSRWEEDGALYRDPSTGRYMLRIAGRAGTAEVFRFDSNGQPLE